MAHDGRGTGHGNTPAMKKLLLAAALSVSFSSGAAVRGADPVQVRLISINDFHGNLEAASSLTLALPDPGAQAGTPPLRVQVGGAAALAGSAKKLRPGSP